MYKKILPILVSLLLIIGISESAFARQSVTATLHASPTSYSGKCPHKITFKGQIRATQAGRVQYKFIRSDGANAPIHTLNFNKPGIKHVSTTWTLGGPGFPAHKRWQAIQIVYPQNVTSNKAYFRVKCQKQRRLPDLVIDKISLNKECKVVVKVRNRGPGLIPNDVWSQHHPKSAGVYLYINGNSWGGATIWGFDPGRNLKFSGGTATYTSKLRVPNSANITAKVDLWNVVKEANENNNKRASRLSCKKVVSERDLTVKIANCPTVVKPGQNLNAGIRVQGKSSFPNALSSVVVDLILTSRYGYPSPAPYATYSPNYSDGVLLLGGREHTAFNGPGTVNVKLNGSNTIPSDTPNGTYYLGAVIDAGNNVQERNERNNVSFCKLRVENARRIVPQNFQIEKKIRKFINRP